MSDPREILSRYFEDGFLTVSRWNELAMELMEWRDREAGYRAERQYRIGYDDGWSDREREETKLLSEEV